MSAGHKIPPVTLKKVQGKFMALVEAVEPFARAWHNADLAANVLTSTQLTDKKSGKTLYKLNMPSKGKVKSNLANAMISQTQWDTILKAYMELKEV